MNNQPTSPLTPVPPKPAVSLVHEVAGGLFRRKGVLSAILAALTGLPGLLLKLQAVPGLHLATWVVNAMLVTALVAGFLAPILGSVDQSDAAARAATMGPGGGDA
jgi:hypothetical protein